MEIPEGSGARAIARILNDAGVLRSPTGFVVAVVVRGARGSLKAGTYEVSARESGPILIRRLVAGDTLPADLAVTFPEGFTLAQIAERLAARGVVAKDAFLDAATGDRFRGEFTFLKDAPSGTSLEGYLFPDTYRLARGTSPEDIIRRMLRRFAEQYEVAEKSVEGTQFSILHSPFSIHAVVTMASIIEREVRTPEDRRLVAGILWKRVAARIGLDADATIRYALNKWDGRLTVDDLRVDSPYNTRRYRGLPPGPIGNPGLESLKAALAPTESDYLYYLSAADDKRTIFSRTLDEHNAAKAQHLR